MSFIYLSSRTISQCASGSEDEMETCMATFGIEFGPLGYSEKNGQNFDRQCGLP